MNITVSNKKEKKRGGLVATQWRESKGKRKKVPKLKASLKNVQSHSLSLSFLSKIHQKWLFAFNISITVTDSFFFSSIHEPIFSHNPSNLDLYHGTYVLSLILLLAWIQIHHVLLFFVMPPILHDQCQFFGISKKVKEKEVFE